MARISKIDISTEAGKTLLKDYIEWRKTGWSPFVNPGCVDHYRSREIYQQVSQNAFRGQAKKIAKKAIEQLPADDNPEQEDDEENDDDYIYQEEEAEEEDVVDDNVEIDFSEIFLDSERDEREHIQCHLKSRIKNGIRDPMKEVYPTRDRIFMLFELDGDVRDENANQFEFSACGNKVYRWSGVPEELVQLHYILTNMPPNMPPNLVELHCLGPKVSQRSSMTVVFRFTSNTIFHFKCSFSAKMKM
jgi:hypothetical protein